MIAVQFDFSQFAQMLKGVEGELEATISTGLDQLATIATTNAKSSTLFKNRTGKLRREIAFTKSGAFTREVLSPTSYAHYVEFGNNEKGPKIYPVKAKALRFVINGQVFFRKWVRSHGPLPYIGNARKLTASFLPDFIQLKLKRLAERYTK